MPAMPPRSANVMSRRSARPTSTPIPSSEDTTYWLAETTAPFNDRLFPVTVLTGTDMDWTVRELTRMREAGSRAFQVRAEPVGGERSLAHPDFDPVWAAAADLGMAAVFHIGGARTDVDKGWYFNGGSPFSAPL